MTGADDHSGLRIAVCDRENQVPGRRHRAWRRADGDKACGSAPCLRRQAATRQ
jgi:hypothetical protein